MKPYSGQILNPSQESFNKRLSRARKCVECAFGILFAKWRILSVIETYKDTADSIIKAICGFISAISTFMYITCD
ncbi:unnamed protein product [Acanthoscelides obtectus]|uniref:DDE Tnp4 domain-containing protein n=1 Tax=Acanthoscelides obtectus TaxID=200917 RepID=A0A9P0Q562_ACAOB|nr:unnamed protein product [Acanthoscelides obtectus]CAK1660177.1 hypothetical protein AOBTE_LOCUS21893 [Acanthoscelides obtectus]